MKFNKIILSLLFLVFPSMIFSEGVMINRYTSLSINNHVVDCNPLKKTLSQHLPKNIENISEAINHLLAGTGYELDNWAFNHFSSLKVASVHRWVKHLTVLDAIQAISGEPYFLVIDPVNHIVGFKLKKPFNSWEEVNA